MFQKVLVANRGEIAVRIIRALREMGIQSVAVYSEADRDAMHAELADEAICIGPAKSLDSYQNPVAILSAAMVTGVDAIHPGYGFLSERHDFVKMCQQLDISFIGPSSEVIELMGNKHNARKSMHQAGVPITPGSQGLVSNLEEARQIADEIGFPLMIKASDGGGGKGMRRVDNEKDFEKLFIQAQNETQSIYGNEDLYIEKVIYPAKHIEVQLLADHHGNVIHLGERDCSLQRKNQKVIEVAPAYYLSKDIRQAICQTAVEAAQAIGYRNAGTIEFLLDDAGNYYFMEMNTRLQVEHPISEMITGIDIVKEQIKIAAGEVLSYNQKDIQFNGVSIEARLNAENPLANFQPSSGHIKQLNLPSGGLGLRVESGIYAPSFLSPFYDSMVAKIVVHQTQASEAWSLLLRALTEFSIEGIYSNVELLEALANDSVVQAGDYHTQWLETNFLPEWIESEAVESEKGVN